MFPGQTTRTAHDEPFPEATLVAGIALAVCGALLMRLDPDILAMPRRRHTAESALARYRRGDRVGAAAQQARDTLIGVLPKNLLGGIGRGLVVAGVGILAVRLLDVLACDGETRR